MHRCLCDAQNGGIDHGADVVQARVAETRDDIGVGSLRSPGCLTDHVEKTGDATMFVVVVLDADRAVDRIDCVDLGGGPRHRTCRRPDRVSHRRGGVGVDEQ